MTSHDIGFDSGPEAPQTTAEELLGWAAGKYAVVVVEFDAECGIDAQPEGFRRRSYKSVPLGLDENPGLAGTDVHGDYEDD